MTTMEINVSDYISEDEILDEIRYEIKNKANLFIREWLTNNGENIVAELLKKQAFDDLVATYIESHKTAFKERITAKLDEILADDFSFTYRLADSKAIKEVLAEIMQSDETKDACQAKAIEIINKGNYDVKEMVSHSEALQDVINGVVENRTEDVTAMVNEMIDDPEDAKYHFADKLGYEVTERIGDFIGDLLKEKRKEV